MKLTTLLLALVTASSDDGGEGSDDFTLCTFSNCPEQIMLFPYNETTADSCKGDALDCKEAIEFSHKNFDGADNNTLKDIQEKACDYMGTWVNMSIDDPKFSCFKTCEDQDQIDAHFVIRTFAKQDCFDYQTDQIFPPPPYEYDYGDGDDYSGGDDQHESEVATQLSADGNLSLKHSSTKAIAGVVCIAVGLIALAAAVVLALRGKQARESAPVLRPNMALI